MSEPDVSFDMVHGKQAIDVFSFGFDQGQKFVMHRIDGILFASTSDSETVKEIEKFAHEFWGDDAE